jgi:hypothetical protein
MHIMQNENRQPKNVRHERKHINVPYATEGRLDKTTHDIYSVLGIETDLIIVEGREYTVLSEWLGIARNTILTNQRLTAPAAQEADLAARVIEMPVQHAQVPEHQPRVNPCVALIYKTLGIDTVDVVLQETSGLIGARDIVYTVLIEYMATAKIVLRNHLERTAPADREPKAATVLEPIGGLNLQDFYVGEPEYPVKVLARLFGARYVRVLGPDNATYWILSQQAGNPIFFDEVLTRLGLYA